MMAAASRFVISLTSSEDILRSTTMSPLFTKSKSLVLDVFQTKLNGKLLLLGYGRCAP